MSGVILIDRLYFKTRRLLKIVVVFSVLHLVDSPCKLVFPPVANREQCAYINELNEMNLIVLMKNSLLLVVYLTYCQETLLYFNNKFKSWSRQELINNYLLTKLIYKNEPFKRLRTQCPFIYFVLWFVDAKPLQSNDYFMYTFVFSVLQSRELRESNVSSSNISKYD